MIEVAESRHIRTANELMLIVPVKLGFIDGADRLVSYSTRLTWILNALAEDLRQAAEETLVDAGSQIERLGSIFNTQWAVRERAGVPELMVSAVFDRSWEDYFHLLVDRTGPMLDLIFCHCEGVAGRTCRDGYEAFAGFIRANQVQTSFFHSELRDLTVDDLRIVRHFGDTASDNGPLPSLDELTLESLRRAQRRRNPDALMQDLKQRGAEAVVSLLELRKYFPEREENRGAPSAQDVFDRAAVQLLYPKRVLLDDLTLQLPAEAGAWLRSLRELGATAVPSPRQHVQLSRADLNNIQGNILLPYDGVVEGDLVLVLCEGPGQRAALLEHFSKVVHTEGVDTARAADPVRINVAITYPGLVRIGLDESLYRALPLEFRQGMERRSAIIGDVGDPNHPKYWLRPKLASGTAIEMDAVDFVLTVQGGKEAERAKALELLVRLGAGVMHRQPLQRNQRAGQMVDAFGFLDPGDANTGSQPTANASLLERDLTRAAQRSDVVQLGELLLGYPDSRGEVARCADRSRDAACAEIFHQGSFVVLRKLEQHVAAMKAFLDANRGDDRAVGDVLGRDAQGKPLVDKDAASNDFDYSKDPHGRSCPLHAHVRLSNPRNGSEDTRVPRIMRRGFSYKNRDDEGLMFLAYGTNIAAQFEVIQRWLNGGNSTGIFSHHNDVISGTPLWEGAVQPDTWQAPPQRLVSLRWGMYLFVPARSALRKLSQLALRPSVVAASHASPVGLQILAELDAVTDSTRARLAWKQLLEAEEWRPRAAHVWSLIRAQRQPRRTPYGWLVGDTDHARAVLCDDGQNFSVREYWTRLSDTIGEHYLGLDERAGKLAGSRCPRDAIFEQRQEQITHTRAGERANRYVYEQISADKAFEKAVGLSYAVLADFNGVVDIRAFVALVVGHLAKDWIGVPTQDPRELVQYMQSFNIVSRFAFQPYPDDVLRRQALECGAFLRAGYAADDLTDPMSMFMRDQRQGNTSRPGQPVSPSDEAIRVARMGAIVGFAPPTMANLISVILRWRSSGELTRQATLAAQRTDPYVKRQAIEQPLLEALREAPIPPSLYRTVVTPWGDARPGELVVVSLQSTWIDAELRGYHEPWQWLFGGAYAAGGGAAGTLHGCPGRFPALAAMCGVMAALVDCRNFEWTGPYLLKVDAAQLKGAQAVRYRSSAGRPQRNSAPPPAS